MMNRSYSKVLSVAMFGTIQKFSNIVLVVYKDDVFFLAGAATCGFILQGICKIYGNSQNRRHRRRIINFIARKGWIIAFFGAFAIRTAPKILSSRAFRESIYGALPYNFSDTEKNRRLILSVTNDKISDKLKSRFLFFIKILEWGSTLSLITIFIIYMIQTLLLNPEILEFAFSIVKLYKNVMIHMWTGQIPHDRTFIQLFLLWRFFMGGY